MGIIEDAVDQVDRLNAPASEVTSVLAGRVCTNTSLRLAARRLGQLYDEALAPLNLKATQLGLVAEIDKLEGADRLGPSLQELAGRLAIQLSALTHALKPLVRDGLVEIRQDARDRRTKRAALTPLGKTRLAEGLVHWAAVNDQVEAVLGAASAASLRALADQVSSDAFVIAYKEKRRLPCQ